MIEQFVIKYVIPRTVQVVIHLIFQYVQNVKMDTFYNNNQVIHYVIRIHVH